MIVQLGKRTNKEAIEEVIFTLCNYKEMKISELSAVLGRSDKYLLREFITPMRESGKLVYTKPEMPNHPEQSYKVMPAEIKRQQDQN
jgi:ATP-dependent DNA helicase RecG